MKANKKTYNKKYFEDRDNLDLRIATSLEIIMKEKKYKSILDVGCGTGLLVKFFKNKKYKAVGCDIENEAIYAAKKINNVKVIKASATKLPFKDNSFDMITSISVVEHLTPKQVEEFLKEAKRVLKKNGYIFLVTPNYATPIRLIQGKKWFGYSDPTHINFYTPNSLKNTLKKYFFSEIKTSFKTVYDLPFDWDLPDFFKLFPRPLTYFLTYLLTSTPFTFIRNSFWIGGINHK